MFKKSLQISEDPASSVQVDTSSTILPKLYLKHAKITLNQCSSTKFSNGALELITDSRNMRNSSFKLFNVMYSMSKSIFSHYLMSSAIDDKFKVLILILYI